MLLQLLATVPLVILCVLGFLLITSPVRKKNPAIIMFGLFLFIRALIYFSLTKTLFDFSSLHHVYAMNRGLIFLFNDPILYFAFLSLAFPIKLIFKRYWFLLLPGLILGSIYKIAFLSQTYDAQEIIAFSPWFSEPIKQFPIIFRLQKIIEIVLNVFSLGYLLIYVKILIFDFSSFVRNNFSNEKTVNIQWIICLATYFLIVAGLYVIANISPSPFLTGGIAILEILFGFTIYFIFHNTYNWINIPLLQSFFLSFLKSKETVLLNWFHPSSKKGNEGSSSEIILKDAKFEEFKQKLFTYFEKEKPYLKKDLCLNDIALSIGTNRTYISHLLSNELNTNFYSFVNSFRIEEAKRKMINHPDKNNSIVADECGFNSYTTFIKYFEKKEHINPATWRSKNTSQPHFSE